MQTKKKGLCIELTQGQYDHLYNIMCSQDEIIDYLNESDDFDPQTFDNLFDNICAAKETYLSNSVKGAQFMTKHKTTPKEKTIIKLMEMVIDTLSTCEDLSDPAFSMYYVMQDAVNKEVIYPMEGN